MSFHEDSFHETKRERKKYENKKQKALRYIDHTLNRLYHLQEKDQNYMYKKLTVIKKMVNDI